MITVKTLYDTGRQGTSIVDYLIESVADGPAQEQHAHFDGTRYYTNAGTPPGRWLGGGLDGLGDDDRHLHAGRRVGADQLRALIQDGADPITHRLLGRTFPAHVSTADRVRALTADLSAHLSADERAARIEQIERQVARTNKAKAVHGFDFTFAPPKSVSVVWALGDAGVREQVEAAHHDAINHVVAMMEADSIRTRQGAGGVVQTETRGVVAAAFDHWDSREGDPHLHTHLVVANRVQGPDGRWRTLDSRGALMPAQVALSEAYDNHLMDSLSSRLGVEWHVRSISRTGREHWEIDGVDDRLLKVFSTRHAQIEAAREEAGADGSGHWDADAKAWAGTRSDKKHHSLEELTRSWRERARQVAGDQPLRGVTGRPLPAPGTVPGQPGTRTHPVRAADITDDQVAQLAGGVLVALQSSRAHWSTWNIRAEAQRAARRIRFETPGQRDQFTGRLTEAVTARCVRVDYATTAHTPARYRRRDGSSRFVPENSAIFTTQVLLDAEDALVRWSRSTDAPRLTNPQSLATSGRRAPSEDQLAAIEAVATSGRRLDLMVGPAGAGKTTALSALVEAWQAEHGAGSVTALAPSSAAAEVLGESLGAPADNVSMWLTLRRAAAERDSHMDFLRQAGEWLDQGGRVADIRDSLAVVDPTTAGLPDRRIRAAIDTALHRIENTPMQKARLEAGDLIIVDEASMAATIPLREIVAQADAAGAKVLAVGDPDQLSAVEAGGAFGMLIDAQPDKVASLKTIHRFVDDWQGPASLALRAGDRRAVETYTSRGAVQAGTQEEVLDQVHAAWAAETAQGRTSLMVAADNATAAELAARARADLKSAGKVGGREVTLADGNTASAGDLIVTRKNARALRSGRHWAHNGATWHVQAVSADGAMLVTPTADPAAEAIHLPADYVAAQVELGYATTIHRAQGRTVDDCHVVVTPDMGRQGLYVGMTRGRTSNIAHVVTDGAAVDDDLMPQSAQEPANILTDVLARDTAPATARRAADRHADQVESVKRLADEYTTIAAGEAAWGWENSLPRLLPSQADRLLADDYSDALAKELRRSHRAGLDVSTVLPALAGAKPLNEAHPAADLAGRVAKARKAHTAAGGQRRLIAGLIPAAPPAADPDIARALDEREKLITARASAVLHQALTEGQPWTKDLGPVPADARVRAQWLEAARTVAAYRDRYGIIDPPSGPVTATTHDASLEATLGPVVSHIDRTVVEDRRRATQALLRARRLSEQAPRKTPPAPGRAPGVPTVNRPGMRPVGTPQQQAPGQQQRRGQEPGREQNRERGRDL
ncbi:MobF family relaxase [Actinomyces sp.]|uniref:MobF family relaxase n=1 Tax=Actinomyces sp. TaxID=29317 RepID=UPI0026DABE9D|nr:MobF family relaxase [Actinomyces sp.]MDO4655652.1 MobF family relaxase [Actinomyces sp.]